VLTKLPTAARESERGYYAFGSDRRVVGTPATDHRFTGQKVDGSGLYYYNARYYDPVIGQFVSPDTIVPQPGRVDGYNRYMYVMGNPLRYNDPSGHCKMLADGGRDTVGDKACWDTAFAIHGYGHTEQGFAEDWNVSPDAWLQNIAGQDYATVEYLQPFHDKYAQEFRSRTGLNTAVPGSHSASPQHPVEYLQNPCEVWDCVDIGLNLAVIAGDMLRVASPLCGPAVVACNVTGRAIVRSATLAGYAYTAYSYASGQSSDYDVAYVIAGDFASLNNTMPMATSMSATAQLFWNIIDPFVNDDLQWTPITGQFVK
jgi:RHS repeat-associated protein